ncbi:MAG TPA: DciA family protein [Opitutaceae bacterium]|nr:DciA family protein [Opitutaceae bacterium]
MNREPHHFSRAAEELVGDLRRIPGEEPRRQKLRPTHPLAAVVDELVTKYQIGRASPEQTIRDHWVEIVGAANAAYAHAARLERGGRTLVVLAGHAVVRNELFLHRQSIVEKLRKLPGCAGVKELNLRAG